MNILLTGAEGNFGTEFRRQAAGNAGLRVVAVGRGDWPDLPDELVGIDVVIHAASDLRTPASVAPVQLMHSNVMSTAMLLEAVQRSGVKKFVFLSSCAVYGEDMRTGEASLCCPITINGMSKHLNEKLIAEFCEANGIEFQILRVFNSYGGNDRFSIFSHAKRALLSNKPFTLNNRGRMQRDFIHVADVASIVLKLSGSVLAYSVVNIGTGTATKVSVLVDMLAAKFPEFIVRHGVTQEAEYSRADTGRLREFWSNDFVRVEDYLHNTFAPDIAALRFAMQPSGVAPL